MVIILSAWATYAVQAETRGSAEFEHSATVEEENPIYDTGTEITDETTYLTSIMPQLDGELAYSYDSMTRDELVVHADISLQGQAIPSENPDPTDNPGEFDHFPEEFWQYSYQLEEDVSQVETGETNRVEFEIDVAAERDRIVEIDDAIGEYPRTWEIKLIADITVYDAAEETVVKTDEKEVRILLRADLHVVDETEGLSETGSDALTSAQQFGPPLILVSSLLLLSGATVARHRGMIAPPQTSPSPFEQQREEFDEWISAGTIPQSYLSDPVVKLGSLKSLVDVAIDTNNRVIEAVDRDEYYVLAGDVVYTFSPESDDEA